MRKVFLVIAVGAFTLVSAPTGHAVALKLAEVHNPAPSAGNAFGTSVATHADIDGDGAADLVVGAPGEGLVRVFSWRRRPPIVTGRSLHGITPPIFKALATLIRRVTLSLNQGSGSESPAPVART